MAKNGKSNPSAAWHQYNLKFSPTDPRDVELWNWIMEDRETSALNLGGTLKWLLHEYYKERSESRSIATPLKFLRGTVTPGPRYARRRSDDDEADDPNNDPLAQAWMSDEFDY